MIAVISPAKSLDFTATAQKQFSHARLTESTDQLVDVMRKKSANQIKKLMSISDNLAVLNRDRYAAFQSDHDSENAKQAVLAFRGDVYRGLSAEDFSDDDFAFAQQHIRILSGLYGLLKPLDLIQPYRLEMGTKLKVKRAKNLYEFWGDRITSLLEADAAENGDVAVANLASKEYFHAVRPEALSGPVYHMNFKEYRNGQLKLISFNAKRARGLMCQYMVKNRVTDVHELRQFDLEDYGFNAELSTEFEWLFTR